LISTIIAKPTKVCNASCTYCCAPPDGAPKWSLDEFKTLFDRLAPHLTGRAIIIWHGGEPMLMGPDFYKSAWDHVQKVKPGIRFSIQSNLLGYESKRWFEVFRDIMEGSISTSYDPDEKFREYRGSTELYSRLFWSRMDKILDDGFHPKVIGTYAEESAPLAEGMYERALSYGGRAFDVRFNYRYPAGRNTGEGEAISPDTYGKMLLRVYNRWIKDLPDFTVTPLDEMLKKTIFMETERCPWTKSCGGRFLGIEPNGDAYNCSEFADLGGEEFRFGNVFKETVPEMMASAAARAIKRRRIDTPLDCQSCRHFGECEGGCARDAVLYEHGMGGKFHYCWSWMQVFDRIKESVKSGEADGAIRKYGLDPAAVRQRRGLPILERELVA
jgi:radical SAM protein with 4Fe4S-binding SPASM domain